MIDRLNENNDRLNSKLQKLIPYIVQYSEKSILRVHYQIFGIIVKTSDGSFLLDENRFTCHLVLKNLILSCDKYKIELALNLL